QMPFNKIRHNPISKFNDCIQETRVPTSTLPDAVFKAYDIRGIVPSQLNPDFAYRLGLALAQRATQEGVDTLVVGCDGRHSSPDLSKALQNGINDGGINTLDIGIVPTPLVYFGANVRNTGSGV